MTVITHTYYLPDAGPEPVAAKGYVRWFPMVPGQLPDGTVVPTPFTAKLDETGKMTVDVAAHGTGWVWGVTRKIYGLLQTTRYYLVPNTSAELDLRDLVEVDPQTADPTAPADPGWYAHLELLAERQVGVVHVVTGTEPRVDFGTVIWIGGSTQPVNMAELTDIWFKPAA